MNPADARLIEQIKQGTRGGRAVLCSVARRGKALERDEPDRAAFLLTVVRSHPLYKGGRLAFDMLELEDLMLDPPPAGPPANTAPIPRVRFGPVHEVHDGSEAGEPEPELLSSDYLYDFFVLGLLDLLGRGMAA
ncbi:MAG TPA: hypothetical protein VIH93_14785 [Thermoanaerobaculia bacterium]